MPCPKVLCFHSHTAAVWRLHARRYSKGGGDCREYGDEDVEDFAPSGVVVEGSHSGNLDLVVSS